MATQNGNDPLSGLKTRPMDPHLTVVTRRTYHLAHEATLEPSEEQLPLQKTPVFGDSGELVEDVDLSIYKRGTDVVVKGKAHAPNGRPVPELEVAVSVGRRRHQVLVLGDRTSRLEDGRVRFSEPEPFSSMPLDYTRAYGGSDEAAREELDVHGLGAIQEYTKADLSNANLCVYERNYVGRGYAIKEQTADGLALPNVEDPEDRLTPERLLVKDPVRWYEQPLPAGFGWFDHRWFPRCAFLGMAWNFNPKNPYPGPEDPPIREMELGYVPRDVFVPKELRESISDRALNGAHPAMILPLLQGDEEITLTHMDPEHAELVFRLPGERPRMFVKPLADDQVELEPTLHSVIVDKEQGLVSLVWGGRTKTTYPHGPEHLERVAYRVIW